MLSISASTCAISCSALGDSVVLLSSAPGASAAMVAATMVTATMAIAIEKTARGVLCANGLANRMGSSSLEPAFWPAIDPQHSSFNNGRKYPGNKQAVLSLGP